MSTRTEQDPSRTPPKATLHHAFLTNLSAGVRLDIVLVSAIISLLGLRLYLYLTGFPQVGGKSIHIAHMLYGGLLMIVAIVILLAFLDHTAHVVAALLGGAGFGVFIDELGKFITRDINYFYRPAISIIYLIFIALYLFMREIMDRRHVTSETSLANALEISKSVVNRSASVSDLHRLERYLKQVESGNPLARALQTEIDRVRSEHQAGRIEALLAWVRLRYHRVMHRPWMRLAVVIACVVATGLAFVVAVVETVVRSGSKLSTLLQSGHLSLVGGLTFATCALACTAVGLLLLPGSRPTGYRWLRRGALISIFLTQIFLFYYIQFYALLGLAGEVLVLGPLSTMLAQTRPGHHTPSLG